MIVSFSFFYFFSLFIFLFFFLFLRMEQLLFVLLLKMDINKLFKFYWKMEQMLILQSRFFVDSYSFTLFLFFYFLSQFSILWLKEWNNSPFLCCWKWIWTNCSNFIGKRRSKSWSFKIGLFFFVSFLIIFSYFSIIKWKDGETPLSIAAQKEHKQIVQLLLEKEKSNIDLAILLLK